MLQGISSYLKVITTFRTVRLSIARSTIPLRYCYSNMSKSYYSVLGVEPSATDEEIKEAYYSLSKMYHPDLNVGKKSAESKILEINEAFEILGNKTEREKYDDTMFPKVWEKNNFIYNYKEEPEVPNYIFRRTNPQMAYPYEQFVKHTRGEHKRKRRHFVQRLLYHKSHSSKIFGDHYFK